MYKYEYMYIYIYILAILLSQPKKTGNQPVKWNAINVLNAKMAMFFLPIRTFEHCFAALASLIVALALSSLYDLLQGKTGKNATC